jgi:hypothetical protein
VGQLTTNEATDSERFIVWRVTAGAALERPILGWGPGTTRSAYLANASVGELAQTTRAWSDTHDLFLETAVGSGLLGLLTLLIVLGVVLPRSLRAAPDRAWTLGAAASLGAFAMVEPITVVLTPLLFLFAGIAAGPATRPTRTADPRRARAVGAGVLGLAFLVSCSMFVAAGSERLGIDQGEPWAYRAALDLAPWRVSAAEGLAIRLAVDGRSGDPSISVPAAGEARAVIAKAVADHPWDPGVRPKAIDVEVLLNDLPAAERWAVLQVERFAADAYLLRGVRNQEAASPPG